MPAAGITHRPVTRAVAVGASALLLSTGLIATAGVAPADAAVRCGNRTATIVGTPGQDLLRGTSGVDVIHGLGGSDTIIGLAGNDIICGGDGNDHIQGGGGGDTIFAGNGNDTVLAQTGNNVVYAGNGDDEVRGMGGKDRIWGGTGDDELYGANGNDRIFGDAGDDEIYGGGGHDYLVGGSHDDDIRGGPGADVMLGGGNTGNNIGDNCWGGANNDRSNGCEKRTQQWAGFYKLYPRNAVETELESRIMAAREARNLPRAHQAPDHRKIADAWIELAKAEKDKDLEQAGFVETLTGTRFFGSWGYRCNVVQNASPSALVDITISQMTGNPEGTLAARWQWAEQSGDRIAFASDTVSDPNCYFWAMIHEAPIAPV